MEIEMSQRWALCQHSSKTLCPGIADPIVRLRSRCASAGHCASTLASLSASAALAYLNLSSKAEIRDRYSHFRNSVNEAHTFEEM